jgi:hypothetical protein
MKLDKIVFSFYGPYEQFHLCSHDLNKRKVMPKDFSKKCDAFVYVGERGKESRSSEF